MAVNVTQQGLYPELFYAAGFVRDSNGVYHARQDALQQFGGYNDFYDTIFHYATSMDKKKYDFIAVNENFIIWLWKGDYMNLGAGAEIGIYYGGGPQWSCGTQYAMPMTLKLKDNKGNTIFDWNPTKSNWWCTGFNPYYQDMDVSNLTAYGSIDFSDHLDMRKAFYSKYKNDPMWKTSDVTNHIVKFSW